MYKSPSHNQTLRKLYRYTMTTKGCDSTSNHRSSIVLLQERFRQLQRAKEMRKEKERLRLLSEPERTISHRDATVKRYDQTGSFTNSESLLPHQHTTRATTSHQNPIYFQPNLQTKQVGFKKGETGPLFASYMGPTSSSVSSNWTYNNSDDYSDVDTSLHL